MTRCTKLLFAVKLRQYIIPTESLPKEKIYIKKLEKFNHQGTSLAAQHFRLQASNGED